MTVFKNPKTNSSMTIYRSSVPEVTFAVARGRAFCRREGVKIFDGAESRQHDSRQDDRYGATGAQFIWIESEGVGHARIWKGRKASAWLASRYAQNFIGIWSFTVMFV